MATMVAYQKKKEQQLGTLSNCVIRVYFNDNYKYYFLSTLRRKFDPIAMGSSIFSGFDFSEWVRVVRMAGNMGVYFSVYVNHLVLFKAGQITSSDTLLN